MIDLLQRQLRLGEPATIISKAGESVTGILIELSIKHITLERPDEKITILLDNIGSWKVGNASPIPKQMLGKSEEIPENPVKIEATPNFKFALEKILSIKADFSSKIPLAKFPLSEPNFQFPSDAVPDKKNEKFRIEWGRIRDSYKNAQKIKELSPKFGRISQISFSLRSLLDSGFDNGLVWHHHAYVLYLYEKLSEACEAAKKASCLSTDPEIFQNLGYFALEAKNEVLAAYALTKLPFKTVLGIRDPFVYLAGNFVLKFGLKTWVNEGFEKETQFDEPFLGNFLDLCLYLVLSTKPQEYALGKMLEILDGVQRLTIVRDCLKDLQLSISQEYIQTENDFRKILPKEIKTSGKLEIEVPHGKIIQFFPDKKWGHLQDSEGIIRWFSIASVIDDRLLVKLEKHEWADKIFVTFDPSVGPKGSIARSIKILAGDDTPKIPAANKAVSKPEIRFPTWGRDHYQRGKWALEKGNFLKAEEHFRKAIEIKGASFESAVKDLAAMFCRNDVNRSKEGVELLEKFYPEFSDKATIDNLLSQLYLKAGEYEKGIVLLKKLEKNASFARVPQIIQEIAICYFKHGDFSEAEKEFRRILKYRPTDPGVKRNIAACLISQKKYQDAEKVLENLKKSFPDPRIDELFEKLLQARHSDFEKSDIVIETSLSDIASESKLIKFLLEKCEFRGVKQEIKEKKSFSQRDLDNLEEKAREAGTKQPLDRFELFLSAAKISSLLYRDGKPDIFTRYCCRSLASCGDAAVSENKKIDSAKDLYCEALCVYDNLAIMKDDGTKDKDRFLEQDAVNAFSRYLQTALGKAKVDFKPLLQDKSKPVFPQQRAFMERTVRQVFNDIPNKNSFFELIGFLGFKSKFSFQKIILPFIFKTPEIHKLSIDFLTENGIKILNSCTLDDFAKGWEKIRQKHFKNQSDIIMGFENMRDLFNFSTASAEQNIKLLEELKEKLLWELDKQRLEKLVDVLNNLRELCIQEDFQERERLILTIGNLCRDLKANIETDMTKLGVEEFWPFLDFIQEKIKLYQEELYSSSEPKLNLRLAIDNYSPSNNEIELHITVENMTGCSPAEGVNVVIQEDEKVFSLKRREIVLRESLKGGATKTETVPLILTPFAVENGVRMNL